MARKYFFSFIILLTFVSMAIAEVPSQFSFQGVLKDTSGVPVEDDVYAIKFRIYDDSLAGDILWETPGYVPIQTYDGLFQHNLGSREPIPDSIRRFSDLWVGITVNLESEMHPRTKLTSVPFSLFSNYSDSSYFAQHSLQADTSQYARNSLALDGVGRAGFVEENEPNSIDSSMIRDGSISYSDIGFRGFHRAYKAEAQNTYGRNNYGDWQDIDSLTLSIVVLEDSLQVYLNMNLYNLVWQNTPTEIRIIVDDLSVMVVPFNLNVNANFMCPLSMSQIITLREGSHIIKGQARAPIYNNFGVGPRNLLAILLR